MFKRGRLAAVARAAAHAGSWILVAARAAAHAGSWILAAARAAAHGGSWILAAASFPFYAFPSAQRWQGLLLLPAAGLLAWAAGGRWLPRLPRAPANGALLLLGIMTLVSAWATYDLALSLPKLAGMALGLCVYITAASRARTPGGLLGGMALLTLGGLGVAGLGLLGTRWPAAESASKIPQLYQWVSALPGLLRGLPGAPEGFNPNEVGGVLLWAILPATGYALSMAVETLKAARQAQRQAPRSLWMTAARGLAAAYDTTGWLALGLAPAGVMLLVLALTQSRSAYLGLAAASVLALLLALPPRPLRWAAGLLLGGAIGLGLLLGPSLPGVFHSLAQAAPGEVNPALSTASLAQRVTIWGWGWSLVRDFPLTGIGMNTFRHVVYLLYPARCGAAVCDLGHAHNAALQTALDLGLPGLLAVTWLYGAVFYGLGRLYLRSVRQGDWGLKLRVLGLGGGLLAHLVFGLTDAVALGARPGVLLWLLLGLAAGMASPPHPTQDPEGSPPPPALEFDSFRKA